MLVVVEGLDKTGKSTLVEAIAARLDAEVIHRSKPEKHPLLEYESDLDDYVPGSGRHIVCDRWHWGETVWPTVYDRPTQYTPEMFLHTELYLQSRGALMVYAHAPAHEIIARLDDPYPPPEKVQPALDLFDVAWGRSRLLKVGYDFARADFAGAVRHFIDAATLLEEWARQRYVVTPHWVGHTSPHVLLVGERPGPSDLTQATAPFRPFGGAGTYLMRALEEFPSVALTNAHDSVAEVPLRALWIALHRPRVVGLGGRADVALGAQGVPHGVVPHPQWVRRFHHDRLPEYPGLIRRAMLGEDTREETRTWPK